MQLEWERIWTKVWLLGALESDLREPGDFVATEIGRESVLIVRQAGRRRARFLQRLPASRQPPAPDAAHGSDRLVQVPVPPLGVRARRLRSSASPISTPSRRAPRPAAASRNCRATAWGGFVWFSLDPNVGRCATSSSRCTEHLDPYNFHEDGADARHHGRVELQLEGVGRRVQRELPRAGHPPAAACGTCTTSTSRSTATSGTTAT